MVRGRWREAPREGWSGGAGRSWSGATGIEEDEGSGEACGDAEAGS